MRWRRPASALSATGPCTSAKWRPTLSSGAQRDGRQTASHGMRRAAPSMTAKSSSKARREQRRRALRRRQRAQQRADRRRRRRRRRDRHRSDQPSRGARPRRAARGVEGEGRRRSRAASSARAAKRRRCVEARASRRAPAPRSREHGHLLAQVPAVGRAGVSCGAPGATRRRPGCIRNGAVTSEKSKAIERIMPQTEKGPQLRARVGPAQLAGRLRRASCTRACGCRSRPCRRSARTAAPRSRGRSRAWRSSGPCPRCRP